MQLKAANKGEIMALVYKVNDNTNHFGNSERLTPYIYNVSRSVGEGGANLRNDVLLVQNLLNIVFHNFEKMRPIKSDGVCGQHTIGRIKDFQIALKSKGGNSQIKTDGRFDPIHNHAVFTPSQLYIYTIFYLNGIARLKDYRSYLRIAMSVPMDNPKQLEELISFYGSVQPVSHDPFCQVKSFFR